MDLIGKSKLITYIQQHPEAQLPAFLWLKNLEHPKRSRYDNWPNVLSSTQISYGEAQLSASIYRVGLVSNPLINTMHINYIDTVEGLRYKFEQEKERLKTENPDEIVEVVTVILTPPPPVATRVNLLTHSPSVFTENADTDLATGDDELPQLMYTPIAYETALNRAIEIFNSPPETPEFQELMLLLPRIKNYEKHHIEFPKTNFLDIIKYRLDEFDISPLSLVPLIGSENELIPFFAGEQALAAHKLEKLYKFLFMPYMSEK